MALLHIQDKYYVYIKLGISEIPYSKVKVENIFILNISNIFFSPNLLKTHILKLHFCDFFKPKCINFDQIWYFFPGSCWAKHVCNTQISYSYKLFFYQWILYDIQCLCSFALSNYTLKIQPLLFDNLENLKMSIILL